MPLLALEPFMHPTNLFDQDPIEADVARWWVLHTRPRAEKTLARRFLDREVDFYLPLYGREWRKNGRQFNSYLPLFPGYLFLRGNGDDRLSALATNLVVHALPVDDQDLLVNDLLRIYNLLATGAPVTPEERLQPGDPVMVTKGPFAGLEGKLIKRGKQLKLFIEVQFLRRAVSAEVESWMVEPLGI